MNFKEVAFYSAHLYFTFYWFMLVIIILMDTEI